MNLKDEIKSYLKQGWGKSKIKKQIIKDHKIYKGYKDSFFVSFCRDLDDLYNEVKENA